MIDEQEFLIEILAIPAVVDVMLSKKEIMEAVEQTIKVLRTFKRPITPEAVIDYAKAIGLPDNSALMLSAAVARHLGAGGRG